MNKRDGRFWIGVAVSVVWLAWMLCQLKAKGLPAELNAQGDFFAGYFAPLAFLWLVLGYMQQGEELRTQAQELQNSVAQQAELVAVSREQLAQEKEARKNAELQQRRKEQPHFVLSVEQYDDQDTEFQVSLKLTNYGNVAREIFIIQEDDAGDGEVGRADALLAGQSTIVDVQIRRSVRSTFQVLYVDVSGEREGAQFEVGVIGDEPQVTSLLEESQMQ